MKHFKKRFGFSLVEVVIALGLVSIGTLSVVGLLGTSQSARRQSQDDVVLASMVSQVTSKLRTAHFWALATADLRSGSAGALPGTLADSVIYFDVNGDEIIGANPTGDNVFYECQIMKGVDPSFAEFSGGQENLLKAVLHFSWPVSANGDPALRPFKKQIYTSVARYD